ncbi:alpha/beta hydrolase [Nonomuraea sp. NPDC005983]|uniref:alpha/beta fold hydrolase n=1 Tax=Nonomuraea sp. NPDC005983 TaxID=3155595 RepID=UPI0033A39234
MADELHEVLEVSGEPGPYLIVGHSMGEEIARLYAARHRDQVAGMVLVDAPSERMTWMAEEFGRWQYGPLRHWQKALTYALTPCGLIRARLRLAIRRGQEPDLLRRMRRQLPPEMVELGLALELTSGQRRAEVQEGLGRTGVVTALEAERTHFGSMPLTVISKAPYPAPGTYNYEYLHECLAQAVSLARSSRTCPVVGRWVCPYECVSYRHHATDRPPPHYAALDRVATS